MELPHNPESRAVKSLLTPPKIIPPLIELPIYWMGRPLDLNIDFENLGIAPPEPDVRIVKCTIVAARIVWIEPHYSSEDPTAAPESILCFDNNSRIRSPLHYDHLAALLEKMSPLLVRIEIGGSDEA